MTTYTAIPDSSIDPESPVTTGLMTKLRDNPIAIAEGASGAPSINPGAISFGGSGIDGLMTGAFSMADIGAYEATSVSFLAGKTFPSFSIIRSQGNIALGGTITVPPMTAAERLRIIAILGGMALQAGNGGLNGNYPVAGAGAGGSWGNGGDSTAGSGGNGGAGKQFDTAARYWEAFGAPRIIIPGQGGDNGNGVITKAGGILVLIADGDIDLNAGTINVDGENGPADDCAGGGGGCVLCFAGGEIKNGTITARGGNANGFASAAGGAGGFVGLFAPTITGITATVTAGAGSGSHTASGAGSSYSRSGMTKGQLRSLLSRFI